MLTAYGISFLGILSLCARAFPGCIVDNIFVKYAQGLRGFLWLRRRRIRWCVLSNLCCESHMEDSLNFRNAPTASPTCFAFQRGPGGDWWRCLYQWWSHVWCDWLMRYGCEEKLVPHPFCSDFFCPSFGSFCRWGGSPDRLVVCWFTKSTCRSPRHRLQRGFKTVVLRHRWRNGAILQMLSVKRPMSRCNCDCGAGMPWSPGEWRQRLCRRAWCVSSVDLGYGCRLSLLSSIFGVSTVHARIVGTVEYGFSLDLNTCYKFVNDSVWRAR